jgi:hypothetical protein
MELVDNGRENFRKFHNAIQSSIVTFSMKNFDTGKFKVINAKADILPKENDSTCLDEYILSYSWKERDVNETGLFIGYFNISFDKKIYEYSVNYPMGTLVEPIEEELFIYIR